VPQLRSPDSEGADLEIASQGGRRVLKAESLSGECDVAINIKPVLLLGRGVVCCLGVLNYKNYKYREPARGLAVLVSLHSRDTIVERRNFEVTEHRAVKAGRLRLDHRHCRVRGRRSGEQPQS
jgi:hypothetical protein